jgi:chemotaxis protein MotB
MRRPAPAERPRSDRWLVSYADLVTLLLACFATAFAAASEPRAETAPPPPSALPTTPIALPLSPLPALGEVLAPRLAIGDVPVELAQDERGLVISLPESATFSSGRSDLTADAKAFLSQLAEKLRPAPVEVRVEGHTDDRPIRGGLYATNWELSTARASAVVLYLITSAGFEPARLSAAGYGEFHPRVPNDGAENRSRNRRVDVVVIERSGPRDQAVSR